MAQPDTVTRILDIAERMARQGGYNSFSFRDIAGEIGIKAASVHYHFANKEALGAAIAERYTENFLAALGGPEDAVPDEMIQRYVAAYRSALLDDGLMCLCGMFGAEISDLPALVAAKTRMFFERNMDWLSSVYVAKGLDAANARVKAGALIAQLEGAMILARSLGDMALFDQISATPAP
ncbi:TetR/AcrR family transcriptional regulator [Tropicibacter sp. R16_0]|uniref:TetR/AcrR family transcriptional regulator n=1 Tax=Tropicibacter sp. R16_0 TaxID=2821102 RepID=UPI001ADC8F86|nr:TetR/AcrR family transcriptional regulator [Tropicibacter sp. R16_0]MBO9451849.1 TetR/AcrR family transcriptional regulator [Tropicibacter sp. R16_0]